MSPRSGISFYSGSTSPEETNLRPFGILLGEQANQGLTLVMREGEIETLVIPDGLKYSISLNRESGSTTIFFSVLEEGRSRVIDGLTFSPKLELQFVSNDAIKAVNDAAAEVWRALDLLTKKKE